MRQFHSILADYAPLVEMYVLDATLNASGRPAVRLTVLLNNLCSDFILDSCSRRLRAKTSYDELADVCNEFDLEIPEPYGIQYIVIVRRLGGVGK